MNSTCYCQLTAVNSSVLRWTLLATVNSLRYETAFQSVTFGQTKAQNTTQHHIPPQGSLRMNRPAWTCYRCHIRERWTFVFKMEHINTETLQMFSAPSGPLSHGTKWQCLISLTLPILKGRRRSGPRTASGVAKKKCLSCLYWDSNPNCPSRNLIIPLTTLVRPVA